MLVISRQCVCMFFRNNFRTTRLLFFFISLIDNSNKFFIKLEFHSTVHFRLSLKSLVLHCTDAKIYETSELKIGHTPIIRYHTKSLDSNYWLVFHIESKVWMKLTNDGYIKYKMTNITTFVYVSSLVTHVFPYNNCMCLSSLSYWQITKLTQMPLYSMLIYLYEIY